MGRQDGAFDHGPGPGEVLILHGFTDLLASAATRARLMACLGAEEERRRRAFVFPRDRDLFLLAHAVKRLALGRCLGVDPLDLAFARDGNGKPVLATPVHGGSLHTGAFDAAPGFSLSHSGAAVAVCIARAPLVGVDVEAHARAVSLEAMAQIMADAEVADLSASGAAARARAFAYWTLREAFAKAVGLGLSLPPNDVCFRLDGEGAPAVAHVAKHFGTAGDWSLHRCDLGPAHLLAAAVRAPSPVVWRLMPIEGFLACADAAS